MLATRGIAGLVAEVEMTQLAKTSSTRIRQPGPATQTDVDIAGDLTGVTPVDK